MKVKIEVSIVLTCIVGSSLYLHSAKTLDDLRAPPDNRLEPLKGDRRTSIRSGERSVSHLFIWTPDGPEPVEFTNHH